MLLQVALQLLLPLCCLIVSAHRRILGMASVVCVLVKICVSSISLYKLDTDKPTAPFESAHQLTLVCTVSDSKTVSGCHYNLCSNHMQFCSDLLTPPFVCSERFSHSLDTLCPCCTLICAYCDRGQGRFFLFCERFESAAVTIGTLSRCWTLPP